MKIELWDIDKIIPYENNVKIHDQKQIEKIAESIRRFGWDQPIVVDKNGVIIKGHGRTLAAKHLGLDKVPVLVRDDLTDDQVKAARIADNRVAMGDIDTEMLQEELRKIDLDLSGIFDAKELRFLNDVDLTEVAPEAVVPDIVSEMEDEGERESEYIRQAEESEVKITDILGFRTIKAKQQRAVARLISRIEEETGKLGADAFVAFAENYVN
jgi:ParB-like chromosome segregation protein Spo0J